MAENAEGKLGHAQIIFDMTFLKKNLVYVILLAVVLVFALVKPLREFVSDQFGMAATVDKVVAESSFADEDFDVDLKGMNVPDAKLSDYKGQIVFLNFWGTWCAPCRTEWPTIEALYKSKNQKVKFVLIAMQDKEEAVKKFLEENKYTAPVYIAQSPLTPKMLPDVFPTTYVIGRNLQILKKEDSTLDWNSADSQAFIDSVSK